MSTPTSRPMNTGRLGPNIWVIRRGQQFSVKEEGASDCIVPPVTQKLAIRIARLIARASQSELIIQDRLGRIRARDSHGNDPFPPKG